MPQRQNPGSSNAQNLNGGRTAGPARRVPAQQQAPQQFDNSQDDIWDEIENMSNGDEGGFNKMNTSFWLNDKEECEIVLMCSSPIMLHTHSIKCRSQNGKTFFRQETCQKTNSADCLMCTSNNPAIGKAKKSIFFLILDGRGTYLPKDKTFDGVPAPKIFLVPIYLAKQIKQLKDEYGGDITEIVLKISKNTNYMIQFALTKQANGSLTYIAAPEYTGDLPDILEVYQPLDDNALVDFIQQFADHVGAQQQQQQAAPQAGGFNGRQAGGFSRPQQQAPPRGRFGSR